MSWNIQTNQSRPMPNMGLGQMLPMMQQRRAPQPPPQPFHQPPPMYQSGIPQHMAHMPPGLLQPMPGPNTQQYGTQQVPVQGAPMQTLPMPMPQQPPPPQMQHQGMPPHAPHFQPAVQPHSYFGVQPPPDPYGPIATPANPFPTGNPFAGRGWA